MLLFFALGLRQGRGRWYGIGYNCVFKKQRLDEREFFRIVLTSGGVIGD